MFPLNPDLLLFLKFFVVGTCVFFWIRLAFYGLMGTRRHRHHHYGE